MITGKYYRVKRIYLTITSMWSTQLPTKVLSCNMFCNYFQGNTHTHISDVNYRWTRWGAPKYLLKFYIDDGTFDKLKLYWKKKIKWL